MTFTKQQKRMLSRMLNQGACEDPKPLWAEDRCIAASSGFDSDSYTFGFLEFDEWMTDEDIDSWFDEYMRIRIPPNMYWDCTGRAFTNWISWHRNPNGWVSFVHCVAYDY